MVVRSSKVEETLLNGMKEIVFWRLDEANKGLMNSVNVATTMDKICEICIEQCNLHLNLVGSIKKVVDDAKKQGTTEALLEYVIENISKLGKSMHTPAKEHIVGETGPSHVYKSWASSSQRPYVHSFDTIKEPFPVVEEKPDKGENDIRHVGEQEMAESCKDDTLQKTSKQKETKLATIGVTGGEINLYGCKVAFPDNAVKEDTKFKVSVHHDPVKYPENRFPIAPILSVQPSMRFDKEVSVTMRTWYSAAKGEELEAEVFQRMEDGDWEWDQGIQLTDVNEVTFQVKHFSDSVVVSKETHSGGQGSSVDGDVHVLNSVYMHKETKAIKAIFAKDKLAQKEAESYLGDHEEVLKPPEEIRGSCQSSFLVDVKGVSPKAVSYCHKGEANHRAEFKCSVPLTKKWFTCHFWAKNCPEKYTGPVTAEYNVTVTEDGEDEIYAVLSSNAVPTSKASTGESQNPKINIEVRHDESKSVNAVKLAENGGIINNSESDVENSLTIQTPRTN